MDSARIRKLLKRHRSEIEPQLPKLILMASALRYSINSFKTAFAKRPSQLTSSNKMQYHRLKHIQDKLTSMRSNSSIHLQERDITLILIAMYVFRYNTMNKYHDVQVSKHLSAGIKQLEKVYVFSAANKAIAKWNILKLKKAY